MKTIPTARRSVFDYDYPAIVFNVSCHAGRLVRNGVRRVGQWRRAMMPCWGIANLLGVVALVFLLIGRGFSAASEWVARQ